MTPPANFKDALMFKNVDEKFIDSLGLDFSSSEALLQLAVRFPTDLYKWKRSDSGVDQRSSQTEYSGVDISRSSKTYGKVSEFYESLYDGVENEDDSEA